MADSKISDLTALTTPANDDVFAVVDTDAGQTKKITFANLNAATSASVAADDISTGDAAVTIATSTGDITIDAPADIILDADSGAWRFKDNGGSIIELSVGSGNSPTFYVANSDADLVFKGNDGGSAITALTLDMSSGGQLLASPLGVSVPSYSFSGDSNTGMTRPTSDTLQFVTGGSERVRIDSSGRVGIGASSPTTALTIYNSSNPQITFGYDADQSHQLAWDSSTVAIKVDPNNDGSNSSFAVDVDGSERLRIDSNGKLIIADSASHSDDFLQIETPASGGGHGIQIRRNDSNNDQQIGRILFGNNTDTDIATIASKTDGANDSGALLFSTQTASGSSTERLRIDSSGNVGIGTTSPSSKLDMRGTGAVSLNVGSTDGTTARLTLDATNGDASGGDFPLLLSDGTSLSIEANNSGSNAFMTFSTNASEKVRIDSSGNVGIGTSSIDVITQAGGSGFRVLQLENNDGGQINLDHTDAGTGSTLGMINFNRAGETVAHIGGVTDGATDNGQINFRTQPTGGALTERMRIDSSGNVGIGTTSASSTLHVVGDLKIDDITIDGSTISDGGTLTIDVASNLEFDAGSGLFSFKDDGSEVYRITNSSGDISLKSLTSDKDISIQGNDGGSVVSAVTFDMSDAGKATFNNHVVVSDRVIGSSNLILNTVDSNEKIHMDASGYMKFETDGTERMRIDSSGILLVGKTDTTANNSGTEIEGTGTIVSTRASNTNVFLNRTGSDGDIINFRKDNTEIGKISVNSSDFVFTSVVSDKDILFKGSDGGSAITALTLDMSDAGHATFNNQITATNGNFGSSVNTQGVLNLSNGGAEQIEFFTGASSGLSQIQAFNRNDSSYDSLEIIALDFAVKISGTEKFKIGSNGSTTITTTDNTDTLKLVSTDDDANVGPVLNYYRNSGNVADNDYIGRNLFTFNNDAPEVETALAQNVVITDASNGSEDVKYIQEQMTAGSVVERFTISSSEAVFNEGSVDVDFRVESNNNANAIFVNGGTDSVTIGASGVTHFLGGIAVTSENNSIFMSDSDIMDTSDTAAFDTVYGWGAGKALTTGDSNILIGYNAGAAITTGSFNVMVGESAGDGFDTETNNVGLGTGALGGSIAGGEYNVAVGNYTLDALTSGDTNVAVGYQAGSAITTGFKNIAVGSYALDASDTGQENTAIGHQALTADTKGNRSVAIGHGALATQNFTSATSTHNTAIGYSAGNVLTTGTENTIIGALAGDAMTTACCTVAIGSRALGSLTEGGQNIGIGYGALRDTTTASNNIAIGYLSLEENITGTRNTAIGFESLENPDTENDNLAIGHQALGGSVAGGEYNVAVGNYTLDASTSADGNTVLGYNAGSGITTGGANVLIGYQAGQDTVALTTGTDNVVIGKNARTSANDSTNAIVIGEDIAGGSNDFSFGKSGNIVKNDFDADADWSRSSDVRLKRNIEDTTLGLHFINDLRPVKFQWKPSNEVPKIMTSEYNEENKKNLDYISHGFIAQEVKEAIDKHGDQTFGGWHIDETDNETQRVKKNMFIMPLIKAVQELSAQVTTLQEEIKTLKESN